MNGRTTQITRLFANVYLNEFDYFMKHRLRARHYIRYTDDFVVVSESEKYLRELLPPIAAFLRDPLRLSLHPRKVSIRKYRQGIDFLGYVLLPHHRALRTTTKQRMFRTLRECAMVCDNEGEGTEHLAQSLQSYLGVLSHADAYDLGQELQNGCWYWLTA